MGAWVDAKRACEEASRLCSLILEDALRGEVQTAIQAAQEFITRKWISEFRGEQLSQLALDLEIVARQYTAQRALSARIRGIYTGPVTTP